VAYAVHPGAVSTELQRHMPSCMVWVSSHVSGTLFKTPEQGAQTSLYCAIDEKLAVQCGLYFRYVHGENKLLNFNTASRID
jgi:hypothetical protein